MILLDLQQKVTNKHILLRYQVGMMGYAMMGQISNGLHYRLRARAFVFVDTSSGNRVAFVSTDSCMIFTGIKAGVVEQLQQLYGNLYTDDNVMLSGSNEISVM